MFFHIKPYSNEMHQYESSMTLDGQSIPATTAIESSGRPVYAGKGNSASGKARLTFSGTVYERVIGPNDKLPQPVDLNEEYWKEKYLSPTRNIPTEGEPYAQRLKAEGLERGAQEKPYDYMLRVARYMQGTFSYGTPLIPNEDLKTYKIFDSGKLKCNEATMFLARASRTEGIPFRCNPGAMIKPDGEVTYHSRGEFYDRERGWVPVDGAVLVGSGKKDDVFDTFGRDVPKSYERNGWRFIPMMNNSGLGITVKDEGGAGNVGPAFYSEFLQCFAVGMPGKMGGGPAPADCTKAYFTAQSVAYNESSNSWHIASNGGTTGRPGGN
jgi:hypothetical protein